MRETSEPVATARQPAASEPARRGSPRRERCPGRRSLFRGYSNKSCARRPDDCPRVSRRRHPSSKLMGWSVDEGREKLNRHRSFTARLWEVRATQGSILEGYLRQPCPDDDDVVAPFGRRNSRRGYGRAILIEYPLGCHFRSVQR